MDTNQDIPVSTDDQAVDAFLNAEWDKFAAFCEANIKSTDQWMPIITKIRQLCRMTEADMIDAMHEWYEKYYG